MEMTETGKGTSTSSFGSPGRVSHDSQPFYESRLYEGLIHDQVHSDEENAIPEEFLDSHFCQSSESMDQLPDNSVHLMITSPPYNVTKEYDDDLSLDEYRDLLRRVWRETYRVLINGGRACINVANLGRKPYIPLHSYIIEDMHAAGFFMRGEIIWNKGSSASPSTAWGTWKSAKNPVLRDVHEYILVFCKGNYSRQKTAKENDISRDEFLAYTKSVWDFSAVSARAIGHPAPFPLELPLRLIKLYSFVGDVILDPFLGSGTTSLAAVKSNRHYVGYDLNQSYIELANSRVMNVQEEIF
ncbi:MAG TPA: site-specific DNA-methyltransferase [Candidatus Cloacimonadota bacterium]|nr:site-specific DNA-methyltransferase [Candidatus Cloacimonadota bacterium]